MNALKTAALALAGAMMTVPGLAAPAPAPKWRIDRVVVVMRHGVRPPTKPEPLPEGMAPAAWPAWPVGWGELTPHGEQAVALSAAFDRASYAALLAGGCPGLRVVADVDQRTLRTAEVYAGALAPGCPIRIEHVAPGAVDPRFSPFEAAVLMTPEAALTAARGALPAGGLPALDQELAESYALAERILDCRAQPCRLSPPASALSAPEGRAKLRGALGTAGGFAQTLLLEYAEGKPMAEVGWGRASRADITALSALHAREFAITARPAAIAAAGARPLLAEVARALAAPDGPRVSLFVGHDANLAYLGGHLGLHWHARQFAPDDPPPGGALIFERWSNRHGRYRLTVRFRSASLDEIRSLAPLKPDDTQQLDFAACASRAGCDVAGLEAALVRP